MLKFKCSQKSFFVILCIMGLFAILSSTMSKNPVLKPFATSLGAPNDLIGFVASASTIPGILVSLPAASLSDVFGRRKILMFSAFVFASAPFLYFFINSWWQLIPVRFYHGFATAIFVPVTEAIVAEKYPTKLGERISFFSSITAIGRVIAPFLGGYILLLTNYGYSTLYLAVGIAGFTAFITALFFLVEQKKTEPQDLQSKPFKSRIFHGWLKVAENRDIQVISLIQASQYYVFGSVEFFLVGYLAEVAKLDPFSIGVIMGSQIIVLILSRPFLGRISDKVGRRVPIILGSILSVLVLAVFPFNTYIPTLLALSIGYGLGFATVIASTSPLTCEIVPSSLLGTSLGFLSTMMDVGQTTGPIISGIILAISFQYNALFYSLSLILIVSIIVFILQSVKNDQNASENKFRHLL
jgi:MFS family permease